MNKQLLRYTRALLCPVLCLSAFPGAALAEMDNIEPLPGGNQSSEVSSSPCGLLYLGGALMPYAAGDMVRRGDIIFCAAGRALDIISISDLPNLSRVANLRLPGDGHWNMDIAGSYAYLISRSSSSLCIVDISTPTAPVFKSLLPLPVPDAIDISAVEGSACISTTSSGMLVIDAGNPSAPLVVNIMKPIMNFQYGDYDPRSPWIYLADGEDRYLVYTSTDQENIKSVYLRDMQHQVAMGIIWVNGEYHSPVSFSKSSDGHVGITGRWGTWYTEMVAMQSSGVRVLPVQAVTTMGCFPPSCWNSFGIDVEGNWLVQDGGSVFWLHDLIGGYGGPQGEYGEGTPSGGPTATFLKMPYCLSSGPALIDLTDLGTPSKIGYHPSWYSAFRDIDVQGSHAYVVGQDVLRIVDVSSPSSPVEVGHYSIPGSMTLDVSGSYAYVASGAGGGLTILNISNPAAPALVTNLWVADSSMDVRDVAISGTMAYVAMSNGFDVVDITNPATPLVVSSQALPFNTINAITVSGSYAYVAAGSAGLLIFDVSLPWAVLPVGQYDTPGECLDVKISGNRAYVADGSAGVLCIDITNKSLPSFVANFDTPGTAQGLSVVLDKVYIADGGGPRIVDFGGGAPMETASCTDNGLGATKLFVAGGQIYLVGDNGLFILSTVEQPVDHVVTVTNTNDAGPGSLRSAIISANDNILPSRIDFAFSLSGTINLQTPLPPLTNDRTTIDGTTTSGGPCSITLDGTALTAGSSALTAFSNQNVIRGLRIINCFGAAIKIEHGSYNDISDNCIGVAVDGVTAASNGTGIMILGNGFTAVGNDIGSNGKNIIGGNTVADIDCQSAKGTTVANNYIGTNISGTAVLTGAPPLSTGVRIALSSNRSRIIHNLIAGHGDASIGIESQDSVLIDSNKIGTNIAGTMALGNTNTGCRLESASKCIVSGNLISGCTRGVYILGTSSSDSVRNNYIGTDVSGLVPLPNDTGICFADSGSGNLVGGPGAEFGNIISGNTVGIAVSSPYSYLLRITHNNVGTGSGPDTMKQVANATGILLQSAQTVQIDSNNISFNSLIGINALNDCGNLRIVGNLIMGDGPVQSGAGIHLVNGTHDCIVSENIVTNHTSAGIALVYDATDRNMVADNSLYGNSTLDLDLGNDGVTANDYLDVDDGPNDLLNYPAYVISRNGLGQYCASGSGPANGTVKLYLVHRSGYFGNEPHSSGHGGATWRLATVNCDNQGNFVSQICGLDLQLNDVVTALAIDPQNNTSEFSRNVIIQPGQIAGLSPVHLVVYDPNGDSIGTGFNSIIGATYDSLTDANASGGPDDRVLLPTIITGDYRIKVLPDVGAPPGATYSILFLGGTDTVHLASNTLVPAPGDSAMFTHAIAYNPPCCIGATGNVDCDTGDGVDISDLSALIDFLYIAFSPLCCTAEANVDGDVAGGVDISDLSALIDYLYISFTPPAACR